MLLQVVRPSADDCVGCRQMTVTRELAAAAVARRRRRFGRRLMSGITASPF